MRIRRLKELAHPVSERDGFLRPWPDRTFAAALAALPMDDLLAVAHGASGGRVDRALSTPPPERTLEDVAALVSPAAAERLEDLAAASRRP